jgi:hypothetical protein
MSEEHALDKIHELKNRSFSPQLKFRIDSWMRSCSNYAIYDLNSPAHYFMSIFDVFPTVTSFEQEKERIKTALSHWASARYNEILHDNRTKTKNISPLETTFMVLDLIWMDVNAETWRSVREQTNEEEYNAIKYQEKYVDYYMGNQNICTYNPSYPNRLDVIRDYICFDLDMYSMHYNTKNYAKPKENIVKPETRAKNNKPETRLIVSPVASSKQVTNNTKNNYDVFMRFFND